MRILLFDTTAHSLPWPLFLEDLQQLSRERPHGFTFTFVDEAKFLRRRTVALRLATRGLDWLTLNLRKKRHRAIAYGLASNLFHYRRHPVFESDLNCELVDRAISCKPDLVLVLMGFHIAPGSLAAIKAATRATTVNYATDDPFNPRIGTRNLLESIPSYDLYACTKRAIMEDVSRAGCNNVRYVRFGYKPSVHFPDPPQSAEELRNFGADVAFVGEGDADRLPFFTILVDAIPNLNLALYGGLWNLRSSTRRYFRGGVRGRQFRMALGGAKIAVNLVRRENRDDHVMRTFEGPACGAFMLNERTDDHLDMFKEGHEAAYFSSAEELVDKVQYYLTHDTERERIRRAGHVRTLTAGHSYRHRLEEIIDTALG
jgi:hypothetical protein